MCELRVRGTSRGEPVMRVSRSIATVAVFVTAAALVPTAAHAAGAAYQVDTSEVSEAGNCKVESWVSSADNRDFFAAVTQTCAFEGLRPYELSAQFSRLRQDGEWSTGLAPKLKVNLSPSGIGVFGT